MIKNVLIFPILVIFGFAVTTVVTAQTSEPPRDAQNREQHRPNLLQSLGLSKEQIQQIKELNQKMQPEKREGQKKLQDANKALDEAIYADEISEALIAERVKTLQNAQAEMIRHRALMETSIRKILTKEQLVKFREMRESFKPPEDDRNGMRPPPPDGQPRRRMRQTPKPNP